MIYAMISSTSKERANEMAGSIWDGLISQLKKNGRTVRLNGMDKVYPVSVDDEEGAEIARFTSMNDLDKFLNG